MKIIEIDYSIIKMTDQKEIAREKLNFYLGTAEKLHIVFYNKQFVNGVLIGKINDDIFSLRDEHGSTVKIFVVECLKIEEFTDKADMY